MAIQKVRVDDAVGMVVPHDMTKIVPAEYKGPAFRKGHIVCTEDILHLKNIGKEHIYLLELDPGQLHEDDAAMRMGRAIAGNHVACIEPSEGKVNLMAAIDGLLKVDRDLSLAVNLVENAVLSSLHTNRLVKAGDLLASVKVVPLVVDAATVGQVEALCRQNGAVLEVIPLRKLRMGVVITGNEVYYGRIQDRFAAVFAEKSSCYGVDLAEVTYQPDDREKITAAILAYQEQGLDIVVVSGGMSVDPDDVTPEAIRATGAQVVSYGTPVLPGAMFMLAYLDELVVFGMPACGMYAKTTVFDLLLPRVLAGERLDKKDIAELGYGGLCVHCPQCTYPHCPFGK